MFNRTGFSGKTEVELSLAPWQSIISDIVMDVPDDPFNWDKPIDPEDCRLVQSGEQAPGCARRPPRATTGLGYDHGAMTADLANWPAAEQRIAELARTRRGRHRNTALASWRKTRAVELRATGMSYAQIAAEVGYANRGTVHSVVIQALQGREAESVDLLRQVELDRLNAVHAALWPKAMAGDVDAVTALLRVIEARCRLLGLYGGPRTKDSGDGWDNCQGPATVVVRADDCRHQGCERHGRFPVSYADIRLPLRRHREAKAPERRGATSVGPGI
ncbi:MAG: hypothetical protein ACR2JG_10270 [Geodermatophilaceae bacterium]